MATFAATHVATGILRSLKQLIEGCGLDARKMVDQWEVLERGAATWLRSGHLERLILEVYDPADHIDDRRGRFDFSIDYGYYADGDGAFWIDPDTVAYTVKKNGSYPSRCLYRFVAQTASGAASVDGWSDTTLRSTDGMTRHIVGTAIGAGSVGANLTYYQRT